jgi:TolA-binding protein
MSPVDDAVARTQAASLGRLGRVLDGSVDEDQHEAGRARAGVAALAVASSAWRRRPWSRWIFVAAAACLALAAVAGVALRKPARLEYRVTGPMVAEGEWLGAAPESEPISLRFSEGTEIELGPGSKGRVADVSADGARIVLGSGLLRARVVHRARTRWTVAAGPYAIDVTGTAFDVGWSDAGERLELSLHDGSVVVHGPSFPEGIRVAAGQRFVAHARTGGAELSSLFAPEPSAEPGPASPGPPAPAVAEAVEAAGPARVLRSWSDRLADGDFRGVVDAAEARGVDATLGRSSLADLVALSDAARYVHDRALARRGLLAERARFPGSEPARAAAFVLGRMADDGGSRSEALRWYDAYLGESPQGPFAAEALGRKLVALVDAGSADAARATAKDYVRRFPAGAHASYARDLLRGR